MKAKTVYVCTACGNDAPKWMGQCTACNAWNSYVEHKVEKRAKGSGMRPNQRQKVAKISEIEADGTERIDLLDKELNRVLGGGLVKGSVVLLGGEPGIGKSTLLLQNVLGLAVKSLYVSGEESAQQIKMRADRLGLKSELLYILTETELNHILDAADALSPELLVIDSIQTIRSGDLESASGTVSQVRECTTMLQQYAKAKGVPVILVGHINKDGAIAGPKVLEHIVDVVLQFEGDRNHMYRLLRSIKNRFGATDEIGVYEMMPTGIHQVENPSKILLDQQEEEYSGSVIAVNIEGRRPLLVEVQALVSPAVYGNPQRTTTGYELRRLQMLLAVLEKKAGYKFGLQDVFLNIAGGLRVRDPAVDLAIVSALISSLDDLLVAKTMCFAGEVGLGGEIRAVNYIEQRIQEAARLGFEQIVVPKANLKNLSTDSKGIQLIGLSRIEALYDILSF